MSNKNKIVQIVTNKDGSKKRIFHEKKFPTTNFKEFWDNMNKTKRPAKEETKKEEIKELE